jgi:hypothetical protein
MNNKQTLLLKNDVENKTFRFVGIIFSIVWILLSTALYSNAGVSVFAIFFTSAFIFAWIIAWFFRLIRYFRKSKNNQKPNSSKMLYWSYEPLILLIFLALAYSGSLMQTRFYLSNDALNQYAKDVSSGKMDMNFDFHHPQRRIGLYSTSMTDQLPNNGMRFITSSDGLFDSAGFAYFPESAPPVKSKNSYTHLDGAWWLWKQRF